MASDNPSTHSPGPGQANPGLDPQEAWSAIEERVGRLLESIQKMRGVNGQLMKENQKMKLQMGQKPSLPAEQEEAFVSNSKYEEALADMRKMKENLRRMEQLMAELKGNKA